MSLTPNSTNPQRAQETEDALGCIGHAYDSKVVEKMKREIQAASLNQQLEQTRSWLYTQNKEPYCLTCRKMWEVETEMGPERCKNCGARYERNLGWR